MGNISNINITIFKALFAVALFVALTPGVLLTIPRGCSKLVVAGTHAVIFVIVYYLIYKLVSNLVNHMEGFNPKKVMK